MPDGAADREHIVSLIRETERELLTETRPVLRARLQADIDRLKEDLQRHDAAHPPTPASQREAAVVADRLGEIDHTLISLIEVVGLLADGQRENTHTVLAAIDAGRADETEQAALLEVITEALPLLRDLPAAAADATTAAAVQKAEADVTSTSLNARTRLRLTVPIIPLILSAQQEIGLETRIDLGALWAKLTRRTRQDDA